ncbi:hypothetical protein CARUB_v10003165mg [Capsella rubella]|uniref:TF-B3 domain-containing protein n=1 Tax=Capsella rubella TaxID=81985 RepID=R0HBY1_9BRAS|nr:hypothetical protein CARUB_v10003165mg [Capsella rubella]
MAGRRINIPDQPYDAQNPFNIVITLSPFDLEANLFRFMEMSTYVGLLQVPDKPRMIELFDIDTKITTFLTIKEEGQHFKFDGWCNILNRKNYRAGDRIVFWWDLRNSRLISNKLIS